ncbi:hypothetical protein V6N11_013206 [Hibiscus sabdariffa]|uniref:Uncharacterized protein n=1 Tax=Hibiscus sabdariffa TaxID=183260 RepID=A0ABR2A8X8_9ROSI
MKGAPNEKTSKVADEMHIYVATEVLVIVEVYLVSELTVKKSIFRTATIFKDFKASTIIAPIAQTVAGVLLSLLFIDLFGSSHLMVSFVLMTYVPKVSSEPKVRSVEVGRSFGFFSICFSLFLVCGVYYEKVTRLATEVGFMVGSLQSSLCEVKKEIYSTFTKVGAACAHKQKDATAKERLLSEANNKFASMANKVEAMRTSVLRSTETSNTLGAITISVVEASQHSWRDIQIEWRLLPGLRTLALRNAKESYTLRATTISGVETSQHSWKDKYKSSGGFSLLLKLQS